MKYHNKKVIYNGVKYDSKLEAKRGLELELLQRAGEISGLQRQVEFELQPSFKKNGKTYRKISYIADFTYYDNKLKKVIVEDVKSSATKTQAYKLKKKLFEKKYKDLEIKEIYK